MTEDTLPHRPTPGFGRDELNLIDFPIGTLSYKQPLDSDGNRVPELVFAVRNFDEDLGCVVPKRLTTRTSSRHGFPTPKEEQLLIGLMLLTRVKNNFTDARVEFRPGELYSLMDWPNDSTSKRHLRIGLDRLSGVKLKYENSWSNGAGQTYEKDFTTGILDSYQLTTLKSGQSHRVAQPCWIQWSAEVFADIQAGNVTQLNTPEYFGLKYPVAQRMYRFLNRHLAGQTVFEMNLHAFATHVGLAETRHVGKIKARLRNGLQELESLEGFIRPLPLNERYKKLGRGHWIIRFEQAADTTTIRPAKRVVAKVADSQAHQLVKEFHLQWSKNGSHQPSHSELQHAQSVINEYQFSKCVEVLPGVVKMMRTGFAEARWFGATQTFWPQAIEKERRRVLGKAKTSQQSEDVKREEESAKQKKQRRIDLRAIWNKLPDSERKAIQDEVLATADGTVRRKLVEQNFDDVLVELACHRVLEARLADGLIVPQTRLKSAPCTGHAKGHPTGQQS